MGTLRMLRLLCHPPWKEGPGWKKVVMGSTCQGLKHPPVVSRRAFLSPARRSELSSSLCLPSQPCLCTALLWPIPDGTQWTYTASACRTHSRIEARPGQVFLV